MWMSCVVDLFVNIVVIVLVIGLDFVSSPGFPMPFFGLSLVCLFVGVLEIFCWADLFWLRRFGLMMYNI